MKWLKWLFAIVFILVVVFFSARPLIEWRMLPSAAFDQLEPPKAPDYADDYYWVAHPNIQDSSDLVPPNIDKSTDILDQPVDVFFIHSTGYVGPGGWNSNMGPDNSEIQSLQYMLTSMASVFNGCCRVYAPHYREAHIFSFLSDDHISSYQALDLAYEDVEQAFDYFLTHYNQGRPFMIVSHSQGSTHALRLLETRIDNQPLFQQLVAAYTIGYWLPTDKFERGFEQITLCESADQTGCIVSFDSYGEGGYLSGASRHWYKTGWETNKNQSIVCVNPLSWANDQEKVQKDKHLGAMPVEFKRNFSHMLLASNPGYVFQELPEVHPSLTWAQCGDAGELFVAEQKDNAFSNHFDSEDKSYHLLDFSLFYADIRENAKQRVNAYSQ